MHTTFEHSFQPERREARARGRARNRARNPVGSLIAGSLIAIWGIGLLLDNLGLGDVRQYIHRAWPAVLVIVGITLLIHRDPSRNHYGFWGAVWMSAGMCVYASQRDWFHASVWTVLAPVMLVVLGGSFVYRALALRRSTTSTIESAQEEPRHARA